MTQRSPNCPQILARIKELQRGSPRSSGQANKDADAKRASISRQLSQNGCNASIPRQKQASAKRVVRYGAYRTLCVRACDGYYFPISYETKHSLLKVEEAACKSMYLGRESELYTHGTSGDVEQARSLKGERYVDKPFAFQFRDRFDASCAAQIRSGIAGLAELLPPPKIATRVQPRPDPAAQDVVGSLLPRPSIRPSRIAEDVETRANVTGRFSVRVEIEAPAVAIRKLGAAYYYAAIPDPAIFADIFIKEHDLPPFDLVGAARAEETETATLRRARH